MIYNKLKTLAVVIGFLLLSGCAGKHLTVAGDNTLALQGCSPLPNCVSRTQPFELAIPADEAWPKIKAVVAKIPRTDIVEENDVYIHAKCQSRVFRFVDNLELLLHPDKKNISVRSSSAIAIFDFGVNRLRIYQLRKKLEEMKIIKP